MFVTSGAESTSAVAAIHASAELMGRPFCVLSFLTAAHVEHSRLSELRTEKSAKSGLEYGTLARSQLASRAP